MAADLTDEQRAALAAIGSLGGKTRASRLSKAARKTSAKRAAKVRWKDHTPKAKKRKRRSRQGP